MLTFNKAQIARRFHEKPLLLEPSSMSFLSALGSAESAVVEMAYVTSRSDLGKGRPYKLAQGLAFLPIDGVLVHRMDVHIEGMFTGYDYIQSVFSQAIDDPEVEAVVLDISSPGGEVAGAFETASLIAAGRKKKPIYAVVDGYAYSAGYALAAAADKIFVSETGGVGSVGVVTMHVDYSQQLAEQGIKVTYIYAGAHKVDANPYQELSEKARTAIQSRIEASYEVFVSSVATNRRMSPDAVRATEAGLFAGPAAKQVGFADAILSPREAVLVILGELSGSRSIVSGGVMNSTPETAEAPDTAHAADAVVDQKTLERQRISAILGCEDAQGREELANHLAFETDFSAEAAKILLAKSPKAEQAQADTGAAFDAAMVGSGNPDVGAGDSASESEVPAHKRILAAYFLAAGIKH